MTDAASRHITILSASETGNSRTVAEELFSLVAQHHDNTRLLDAAEYSTEELADEDILIMVTSTQGFGEPPFEADEYYNDLMDDDTIDLSHLSFATLGLGDSMYGDDFNLMVRQFDARYEELGGRRIFEHGECDIDFEDDAEEWVTKFLPVLLDELSVKGGDGAGPPSDEATAERVPLAPITTTVAGGGVSADEETPYTAGSSRSGDTTSTRQDARQELTSRIVGRTILSSPDAPKKVFKVTIELPLEVTFEPGDMFSVSYINDRVYLTRLMKLALGEAANVSDAAYQHVYLTLLNERNITQLNRDLLLRYAEVSEHNKALALINDDEELAEYTGSRPTLALFTDFPHTFTPEQLLEVFAKPNRRLYSASNYQGDVGHTVDFTSTQVRYTYKGEEFVGACSNYFERAPLGSPLTASLIPHDRFHLPDNNDSPLIMVGLGSAVASYRAFLQSREHTRVPAAPAWLLVGHRHPDQDHLYASEFEDFLARGILQRYDVAWSRWSEDGRHMQEMIRDVGADLWDWLNCGAHLYLCGHSSETLDSLESAVADALVTSQGLRRDDALEYVTALKMQRRIHR